MNKCAVCRFCRKLDEEREISGYEWFTLMDNMQCKVCNWIPVKTMTFFPSYLRLEYVLNHQCDYCQQNCRNFHGGMDRLCFISHLCQDLKPVSNWTRSPKMGRCVSTKPTRDYDRYDYLQCRQCHRMILPFHSQDLQTLQKHDPDDLVHERPAKNYTCSKCRMVTWGNVFDHAYQDLPQCCVCHQLVQQDEWFQRFCCLDRKFHLECSLKHAKCPSCRMECKFGVNISTSDPTMRNVKIV